MASVVTAIIAFAEAHTLLAYAAAFILSGLEAFPLVGAFVPGSGAIVALAALIPAGVLQLWPLLIATTFGAIAGDGLSFWIGHHYRERTAALWPLRRYPVLIDHGKAFFVQHGGKAIVIARFTPGVRAIVPLVAGMVGMPGLRFYSTNVLSALMWAPAHVVAGLIVGASLTLLGAVAGRLALLVIVLVVLVAAVVWLARGTVRWLAVLAARRRDPLLGWARAKDT
jgi:undecaprenyl-diphosphatase